jgi:predicted porin
MKKLLTTSAILSAVAFASSANAADLQVNVGGFLDFQAGYTSDDLIGAGADQRNDINFGNDAEIHFSVDGKADNGLEYGAVIELEADISQSTAAAGDNSDNGFNADKTFVFLQGGFGRVELGGNTGAEEALSVNTSTFASATGGVDGDFYRFTAAPTNFAGITAPDLALASSGNGGAVSGSNVNEDATKITYYTPRVSGFQAGVSFIPNTEAVGQTTLGTNGYENIWTAGVNYSGDFDGVGVKVAATGIRGSNAEKTAASTDDLEGYDVGANVSFSGFTVGGSYGSFQDVRLTDGVPALNNATSEASYWDAGVGYEMGAYSASVTYLDSSVDSSAANDRDDFSNLVVGVDYKLAPGLTPYAEVAFFDYDSGNGATTASDNSGTVVIVGTELSF